MNMNFGVGYNRFRETCCLHLNMYADEEGSRYFPIADLPD